MSLGVIDRSPDLAQLRDEGYEVDIVGGHLVIRHVPYVNRGRKIEYGILASTLTLAGDRTTTPDTHVALFAGDHPCDISGQPIGPLRHSEAKQMLAEGLQVERAFSCKPSAGYKNYYDKMTNYVGIITAPASSLDPSVTARTYLVGSAETASVFKYTDTASARAGIGKASARLQKHKVAIVGLGGTGSYILDLVAKCPVAKIHLFDFDRFLQHNAFRAPGAASLEQLQAVPMKVHYFQEMYSRLHAGIAVHPVRLDRSTAHLIQDLDFIFLAVDSSRVRKELMDLFREHSKPYIDVGMGIETLAEGELIGQLRVSTSTPEFRCGESRIPTSGDDEDDDYRKNIQIADLNCLNAALAVVRWKKLCGFYQDREREHFSAYATNVNQLLSEELG